MNVQALIAIAASAVVGLACRRLQEQRSAVRQKYDVFLCFRGLDTRNGFTDHLYLGLFAAGLAVFKDDRELLGEQLDPGIYRAIENSKVAIIILSKRHAGSKWCLSELAVIMGRYAERCLLVFPIFYEVDVFDVRHQTGDFGQAFTELVKDHNPEEAQKWKDALRSVTTIRGWTSQEVANGRQGQLVNVVVAKLLTVLRRPWMERLPIFRMKGTASKCQVFLSSGPAAEKGLASHLYYRLEHEGVSVFNEDDHSLIGKDFAHEIFDAISHCRIFLLIITEDYASSTACLDNLAQMVECMNKSRQKIFPIFYKVEPRRLRKLSYRFRTDMLRHKIPHGENAYDRWERSLSLVGSIGGVESEQFCDGNEGKLVEDVVEKVAALLKNPNAWSTSAGF